jgi:tetratricopeptide (TPR) repeat protein
MKPFLLLLSAILLAAATRTSAGVVVLKDGTRLEGKIHPTRDGFVITDASGKTTTVAAADVQSMQPDKSGPADAGAQAQGGIDASSPDLATLRRVAATLRDPRQAIDRYKAFLARNPPGTPRDEAEKELALWQDRATRNLVKVGEEWVTPAQAAQLQKKAETVATDASAMLAAGNFAGAEAAVDSALRDAPNSAALHYLKGVILFRQNKLVPARKAFEQVETLQPANWAAHNNLAVILFQTRAQIPALAEYDKAMLADPQNQKVLDNVAEALHQLPPASAMNDVIKKVVAHFTQQDAALQKTMAEKGMMRIGAQWVPSDEAKTLQAQRADAQAKIDQYHREAVDLPSQLNAMDQDLTIKTNAMKAMVQESTVIDAYGRIVYQPLPLHYYELKQEVEKMTADRVLKQRRLDQLPRLMTEAQQQLTGAQERYAGKQSIVEDLLGAAPATTQSATKPE